MRKSGFTLIELLSCIVIIGILAAASTGFIKNGVSFYMEATANGQTADSENYLASRLKDAFARTVPGLYEIRVSEKGNAVAAGTDGKCLSFIRADAAIPYSGSGTYRIPAPDLRAGTYIAFLHAASDGTFEESMRLPARMNDPLSWCGSACAMARVEKVTGDEDFRKITIEHNPHASALPSGKGRMYLARVRETFCHIDDEKSGAYRTVRRTAQGLTGASVFESDDTGEAYGYLAKSVSAAAFREVPADYNTDGAVQLDTEYDIDGMRQRFVIRMEAVNAE